MPEYKKGPDQTEQKYDLKDPNRPKRTRAKRACLRCQKAHLTCEDERPCNRCVQRGLTDTCKDGFSKKTATSTNRPPAQQQNSSSRTLFPQGSGPAYPVNHGAIQSSVGVSESMGFNPQASPASPTLHGNPAFTQPQIRSMLPLSNVNFIVPFHSNNPALYNYSLRGTGLHLESLNNLTLGAETPPREIITSETPSREPSNAAVFGNGSQPFRGSNMMTDFYSVDHNNPTRYSQDNLQHGLPPAHAIATGPTRFSSPSIETMSSPQPSMDIDVSPEPGIFGGMAGVSTALGYGAKLTGE